jgi:group I intron endonuclease
MYVYAITCLANGKMYIGQHTGRDLCRYFRRKLGMALRGVRGQSKLYAAVRKYGKEQFVIAELRKCANKSELDSVEVAYIKLFGTQSDLLGYNMTSGGEGLNGFNHTTLSKRKISENSFQKNKTHCIHGHEFTPENTQVHKGKYRRCIECDHRRSRVYREKTNVTEV